MILTIFVYLVIAPGSNTRLHHTSGMSKPRLVRQSAIQDNQDDVLSCSPPRLGILPTIPSTADSSVILDDDLPTDILNRPAQLYAVLQNGDSQPQATLSSPKDNSKPP